MSPRAAELAEDIRRYLNERFRIAAGVRDVREGLGYRVYQLQKPKNRHLVDVRPVSSFPATQRVEGVLVIAPPELIASKLIAYQSRRGKPKSGTDWRDLAMLLLNFPDLKNDTGPVAECLRAAAANAEVLESWRELVQQDIVAEDDDDEFA